MASLQFYADRLLNEERPAGLILEPETVEKLLVKATEIYAAYASLDQHVEQIEANPSAVVSIDLSTDITWSEYAIIAPLWLLYVEREQSIQIEAGRIMGIELFGRSSSEVSSEIQLKEQELPRLAFCQVAFTV